MNQFRKNIFLTGPPSSGKTTVIRKVIAGLNLPSNGFYTLEEKAGDRRVAFLMHTVDGKRGYLAREDIDSPYRIRRYGVSIENIEIIAVPSIAPLGSGIIIIDEIGKMECFSEVFKRAAIEALDSPNIVVGTITLGGDEFIREIKSRRDIDILEVTTDNRDLLPDIILRKVAALRKDPPENEDAPKTATA